MALTPEEQAELDALNAKATGVSSNLSPAEQAELDALDRKAEGAPVATSLPAGSPDMVGGMFISPRAPLPEGATPGAQAFPSGEVAGLGEAALTVASSIPATSVGGLAGLAAPSGTGAAVSEAVREALTFEPRTEEGRANLMRMAQFLEPVGTAMKRLEKAVGDTLFEITDSPMAGAVGQAIPTAILEALPGANIVRRGARAVELEEAAPRVEPTVSDPLAASSPEARAEVGEAARSGSVERLAELAEPDVEAIESAGRLGMELDPGSASLSPSFIEMTQALKSDPNSRLRFSEQENIRTLQQRSNELLADLEATPDAGELNESLFRQVNDNISELEAESSALYGQVEQAIPRATAREPVAAKRYISSTLAELGGRTQQLTDAERALMSLLDADEITYAALDRLRKDVGRGFQQGKGPYKDDNEAALRRVYSALSEDQQRVADEFGVGQQYTDARGLVARRKALEDQSVGLFGKDQNKSIVNRVNNAATGITRGDTTAMRQLMDLVPDNRRGDVAAQVLDALMTQGSRGRNELGSGFATAYRAIRRRPRALNELLSELPESARQRFNDIGKVADALFRGIRRENASKTTRDLLTIIDERGGLGRLYETGRDIAAAEGVTTVAGIPGAGAAGVIARNRPSTPRSVAADQLIASREFQQAVENLGNQRSQQRMVNSPVYQRWLRTLDADDIRDIAAVGLVPWLAGSEDQR